jgi:hypothetical protein
MAKPQLRLHDLLAQGESALAAVSTLLGQKLAVLDCSGVEALSLGELATLFSGIPAAWQFVDLDEVIDASSLSEPLAIQICQWVNGDFAELEKPESKQEQGIGADQIGSSGFRVISLANAQA